VFNAINKQDYSTHNNKLGTSSAALGKYDLVYKWHEKEIKKALDDLGIKYTDTKDIQEKFLANPKAQDIVGKARMSDYKKGAEELVNMYPDLNLDVNKMMYLTHYLGKSGAKTYMNNVIKYGVEEADKIFMEWSEEQGAKNRPPSEGMIKFIQKIQ